MAADTNPKPATHRQSVTRTCDQNPPRACTHRVSDRETSMKPPVMAFLLCSLRLVTCAAAASPSLAHVQNLTAPGVSGVLRWWCDEQGHASEPLCVRHEISLQISLTHGTERWQLQQRRQRLLGDGAQQELAQALAAYCNGSAATPMQQASGICKRAGAAEEPLVPMMEQMCVLARCPRPHSATPRPALLECVCPSAGSPCTPGGAYSRGTASACAASGTSCSSGTARRRLWATPAAWKR